MKRLSIAILLILGSLTSWAQFPLPDTAGLGLVVHHYAYTLQYSEEHEQPWWVAYELTKNETYGNKYPVTLTLYDKGTQIGEPIQLTFGATKIYKIEINDYVEELQAVFTHSLSLDPRIGMNMEIVKL